MHQIIEYISCMGYEIYMTEILSFSSFFFDLVLCVCVCVIFEITLAY